MEAHREIGGWSQKKKEVFFPKLIGIVSSREGDIRNIYFYL